MKLGYAHKALGTEPALDEDSFIVNNYHSWYYQQEANNPLSAELGLSLKIY